MYTINIIARNESQRIIGAVALFQKLRKLDEEPLVSNTVSEYEQTAKLFMGDKVTHLITTNSELSIDLLNKKPVTEKENEINVVLVNLNEEEAEGYEEDQALLEEVKSQGLKVVRIATDINPYWEYGDEILKRVKLV